MSRVEQAAGFRVREVRNSRFGQAEVNLDRAVPGQGLVRADGVEVDPIALGVGDEVHDVVDLFEEQPLVLRRPEAAFA
jgi:hypothetical protein